VTTSAICLTFNVVVVAAAAASFHAFTHPEKKPFIDVDSFEQWLMLFGRWQPILATVTEAFGQSNQQQ